MKTAEVCVMFGRRIRDGRGQRVVKENPLLGIDRPKRKKPAERYLRPDEFASFLSVPAVMRENVVRAVLVDTTFRESELCAMNVGDVFTAAGTTWLRAIVKGGLEVTLPLSPDVAAALHEWWLARNMPNPEEPLFVGATEQRYTRRALASVILRLGKKAGITRFPVRPHLIRHTMEVVRRQERIDGQVRSKLLAHSHPRSIDAYTHVLEQELVEARRKQSEGLRRYIGRDYAPGICDRGEPIERN